MIYPRPPMFIAAGLLSACLVTVGLAKPITCPEPIWHDESTMFRVGQEVWPGGATDAFALEAPDTNLYRLSASPSGSFTVATRPGDALEDRLATLMIKPEARVQLDNATDGIGLRVQAPAYTRVNLVFVDAQGREFMTPIHRQTDDGWTYVGTILNTVRNYRGKGQLELALPVTWTGIEFMFPDDTDPADVQAAVKGFERVSRPIEGIPQRLGIDLADPPLGHVYQPGQTVRATFGDPQGNGLVRWSLMDDAGNTLRSGQAMGRAKVRYTLDQPGHYDFVITLDEDGQRLDARQLSVAAIPPNPTPHDRMGISAHFDRPSYNLDIAHLLPVIGVMNIRTGIAWHHVEKAPGRFEMNQPYTKFIQLAEQMDIGGIYLTYGHARHYGGGIPRTPEQTAAFVDYVDYAWRFASRSMDDLMIWNEWSHGTGGFGDFKRTPQGYVDLIEAIVPPIRERYPDTTIIGIGGENPYVYEEPLTAMMRTGVAKHFDSLAIHPYRQPYPPEVTHRPNAEPLDQTARDLLELSNRYGGPDRIDVTEVGYPTFRPYWGVSETEQARYLTRTLAMLHSVPQVHRVYWYSLRDQHEIPLRGVAKDTYSFGQHYYGVFRTEAFNYAPKPAAVALATYTRMTADAEYGTLERLPDEVYRVRVTNRDGSARCTIWWTTGDPVRVTPDHRPVAYTDNMGRSHTTEAATLTITQDPIYVRDAK